MQKIGKKASILIWAIFLSLIISISFLSITTKITKKLKNINKNIDNIELEQVIKNSFIKGENNIKNIWNKTIIIENKSLEKSLKSKEIYELDFSQNSIIDLEMINNSIIHYELKWTKNDAGIISWSLDSYETEEWKLILTNYSWYAKFRLACDNKLENKEKKYKIIENIWDKKIIKTRWIIK